MKQKIWIAAIIAIALAFCLLVYFNNRPFAKYVKTGKNDLEEAGFKGSVREVIEYDSTMSKELQIRRYNKFGYIVYLQYNGLICEYKYNKWGKLARKESKDENVFEITHYKYDRHGNVTEIVEEIKEVYNSNCNYVVGKSVVSNFENRYDKEGSLVSVKETDRDSSYIAVSKYDQYGQLSCKDEYFSGDHCRSEEYYYNNGVLYAFREVFDYGESKQYYETTYNDNGTISQYRIYWNNGNTDGKDEYKYDEQGRLAKEIKLKRSFKDGSKTDDTGFHIWFKGDVIAYVSRYEYEANGSANVAYIEYYPGEDRTVDKEPISKAHYEYDDKGNVIYHCLRSVDNCRSGYNKILYY